LKFPPPPCAVLLVKALIGWNMSLQQSNVPTNNLLLMKLAMGKSSTKGVFSIATLQYRRLTRIITLATMFISFHFNVNEELLQMYL
jgi:hypothetical protein